MIFKKHQTWSRIQTDSLVDVQSISTLFLPSIFHISMFASLQCRYWQYCMTYADFMCLMPITGNVRLNTSRFEVIIPSFVSLPYPTPYSQIYILKCLILILSLISFFIYSCEAGMFPTLKLHSLLYNNPSNLKSTLKYKIQSWGASSNESSSASENSRRWRVHLFIILISTYTPVHV
jgi:hypothetical protein